MSVSGLSPTKRIVVNGLWERLIRVLALRKQRLRLRGSDPRAPRR